jgi:hypothetical protein
MQQTLEHRIRQRAYEIWHANGQVDGMADEHWLAAEREVLSAPSAPAPEAGGSAKAQKRTRPSRAGAQRPAKSTKAHAKS